MYPAKDVVNDDLASVSSAVLTGEVVVSGILISVCGGVLTGVPVREWRSGGIVVWECEVGETMRRRRGFVICFGLGSWF